MNPSVVNKILLARRLCQLGQENLSSNNDLSLAVGVNLLQDAVEAFLLAASEHINANIQAKTPFDGYFDPINEKIKPKELPFRSRLMALNKLRVNSKHYGLTPAHSEVDKLSVTVREFFQEATQSVFGISFASVSLVDLLRDDEAKALLKEAESAFEGGDFEECLVTCRKAIFVRIESQYDVAQFADSESTGGVWGALMGGKAPHYARNMKFIAENVGDATDFIVFDHDALEHELMISGIDSLLFWNIWRLTPEVYRREKSDQWIIKYEFATMEKDGIKERAEYVLDTTISCFVAADSRMAATRSPDRADYYVELRTDGVPVYAKADSKSKAVATTPMGLMRVNVDFRVPALAGGGTYWHVSHFDDGQRLYGYISDDVVAKSHTQ